MRFDGGKGIFEGGEGIAAGASQFRLWHTIGDVFEEGVDSEGKGVVEALETGLRDLGFGAFFDGVFFAGLRGGIIGQAHTVIRLSRVISFMSRHYIEPLTIDDLAHLAGMSSSTLFREFKSIMGRPPIDHLLHLRIERAGRLLQSSPMRIGEVAAAAGFEDSNYFTRQFRRIKGISPREYRARSAPGPIRPAIQG